MSPIWLIGMRTGPTRRELGWATRRWTILRSMPEGLPKKKLIAGVQSQHPIGRSQARRELDWLEQNGYIHEARDESDRRVSPRLADRGGRASG